MEHLILKGHIIHTPTIDEFECFESSYIVVEDGIVEGIYNELPEQFDGIPVIEYKDAIIIPSFIDLHVHAPQYIGMGIGLNLPLIDWLNNYTFPIEGRFSDPNYGRKVYKDFVSDLYDLGTLRSVIFATIHDESNHVLVDLLAEAGLSALVGKVNMNRFAPVDLIEPTSKSIKVTKSFYDSLMQNWVSKGIYPIVTPRFAPSCTEDLMEGLGKLVSQYNIPVQSHLSETEREVHWVKDLYESDISEEVNTYSDIYKKYHLYGETPTVMAHAIYLEEKEIEMAKDDNIYLAHCPNSNMNLSSGIMPLSSLIDKGLKIGLGSDVGAGHSLFMGDTISAAIQNSKLRHVFFGDRIVDEAEAFYLGTMVNGSFFEKAVKCLGEQTPPIGCFEKGFSFDALIIKDEHPLMTALTPLEQLQRFLYCGTKDSIRGRYLAGKGL